MKMTGISNARKALVRNIFLHTICGLSLSFVHCAWGPNPTVQKPFSLPSQFKHRTPLYRPPRRTGSCVGSSFEENVSQKDAGSSRTSHRSADGFNDDYSDDGHKTAYNNLVMIVEEIHRVP